MKTCDPITADIRADICAKCQTPCEHQRNPAWHASACSACHIGRYGTYGDCSGGGEGEGIRGLGDAVAVVAQPIARLIDRVSGGRTHVASCGGCKARQAALNKAVPFS